MKLIYRLTESDFVSSSKGTKKSHKRHGSRLSEARRFSCVYRNTVCFEHTRICSSHKRFCQKPEGSKILLYSRQGCQDFSRTFSSKFKDFLYQIRYTMLKSFMILYTINSTMSFPIFASWEKSSLCFNFQIFLHRRYFVRLWQTTHFGKFLQ